MTARSIASPTPGRVPRLAFISTMEGAAWGGSESLWSATAQEALGQGMEVAISTFASKGPARRVQELVGAGAKWFPWTVPARESFLKRMTRRIVGGIPIAGDPLTLRLSSFKQIFGFRPDAVCISQGGTYDILGHEALRVRLEQSRLPYLVLCRGNDDHFSVWPERRAQTIRFLEGAAQIGFASETNIASARRQLASPLRNATVIQSPIGIQTAPALPWPSGTVAQFATVARLHAGNKGHDLLFQALAAPQWRTRDWHLTLYGDGPDRAWLEDLARFLEIADRITFAGHVDEIVPLWQKSHLLLLPSRTEGAPQALIQAMLCGRPAVVTDVGGCREWLSEAETGFIAAGTTAPLISDALERAWQARDCWEKMGRAANQASIAKLDPAPQSRLLEKLCCLAVQSPA